MAKPASTLKAQQGRSFPTRGGDRQEGPFTPVHAQCRIELTTYPLRVKAKHSKGMKRMRRPLFLPLVTVATSVFGLLGLAAVPAWATSGAHFMPDTSASVTSTGALSVFVDEAGVGNQTVNYTLSWTGTADYGCVNRGQNHPKASNKESTGSGGTNTFSESPINGRVNTTVPVPGTPPPPEAGFSCPNGQTQVLADVSYTATLTDTTNNASIDLTASKIFFTFK